MDVVEPSERITSRNPSRRSALRNTAIAFAMVGSAIVVVDGSWSWAILRLALVGFVGWSLYRLDRRWPAVSVLAGAVLVAVGAGLAPHLLDGAAAPTALASVLMVVSGGTLVVVGTADLLAGARRWWGDSQPIVLI